MLSSLPDKHFLYYETKIKYSLTPFHVKVIDAERLGLRGDMPCQHSTLDSCLAALAACWEIHRCLSFPPMFCYRHCLGVFLNTMYNHFHLSPSIAHSWQSPRIISSQWNYTRLNIFVMDAFLKAWYFSKQIVGKNFFFWLWTKICYCKGKTEKYLTQLWPAQFWAACNTW